MEVPSPFPPPIMLLSFWFATETPQDKFMKGSKSWWAKSQSSFSDIPVPAWVRKKELVPKEEQPLRQCPWPAEPGLQTARGALRAEQPLAASCISLEKSESEFDLWSLFVMCPSSQDEEWNGRIVWRMRLILAWGASSVGSWSFSQDWPLSVCVCVKWKGLV